MAIETLEFEKPIGALLKRIEALQLRPRTTERHRELEDLRSQKVAAAAALKITARDLLALKVVDEIVPEPVGGAHTDLEAASRMVEQALRTNLDQVAALSSTERLERRYHKFRRMGDVGLETTPVATAPDRSTGFPAKTEGYMGPVEALGD